MDSAKLLKRYLKRPPKPFKSIIENGDKEDYFVGLDIQKPESLTPLEMELRIQADRVIFSLNKTISVLNVMAHLPFLLQNNAELIYKNFGDTQAKFIMHILREYDDTYVGCEEENITSFSIIFDTINKINRGKLAHKSVTGKNEDLITDPNLAEVIEFLFSNKCIRQEIQAAESPKTIYYINGFIKELEELKSVAKLKLYISGTEEEARDKQLRQAYKSNVLLTAAINDLKQQLENQRRQLGRELNEKVATFEKYNKKISCIKEEFQISIEKNIHDSERKMMHQCLESEEKQAFLAEDAEKLTKQYETLLDDHLDDEKKLRARRLKTEAQLQNWLVKYDQDIGEKQAEYEELKKEYDEEKEAMDDLEDKMDEQEQEYNILMREKQEEEERIYMEMAYQLLINRSAKIIQRAWRAFRERKAKRKGRKGKKGKDGKDKQVKKPPLKITKKDDPNAVLEQKYKEEVFEELKDPDAFG